MKFAKYTFLVAGTYGVLVLVPQYFLLERNGRDFPPAITHPEYYYGFVGIALVFQLIFFVISTNPIKYRALIGISILEKLAFAVPAAILFSNKMLSPSIFAAGMIDALLGVLFLISFIKAMPERDDELASEHIN